MIRQNNHFVPETYLKRWGDAEPSRLWSYRLLVSHQKVPAWKPKSPRGIAYHTHLYTRTAAAGESDEIEGWLDSAFEAPGALAIEKAVSGSRLTTDDWSRLIRFLAAQDVRTPARMMEMLHRWNEQMQDVVSTSLEKSVEELKEAHREGREIVKDSDPDARFFPSRVTVDRSEGNDDAALRVETIVGRGMYLFSLRHLLTRTVRELLKHRWTIFLSPPNMQWLTTDRPVVCLNYHSESQYDFGGGWGSMGTEIFLPLSPRHLMYTKIGSRSPPRGTVLDTQKATIFQRMIVENAHRYVFGTHPNHFVEQIRPRTVDRRAFEAETELWQRWHDEQSAVERQYYEE